MASQIYEHFSDGAHLAVVLADREARSFGHPLVDTEHLVIGVLQADPRLAAALARTGVTTEALRGDLVDRRGADAPLARGETMFADTLNQTLRGASMFARRKDREVTCTDLLIELMDGHLGGGPELLRRMGGDLNRIRACVIRPRPADDEAESAPDASPKVRRRLLLPNR